MSWPTETEVRAQLKLLAEAALPATQVLDFWPFTFEPGDDMTVLRNSGTGRVDTLVISAAGIDQTEAPKDATRLLGNPRGKNVVGRRYRTWLFDETESALIVKLEAWRVKVNQNPKLGFSPGKSEFVESVSRLQVPLIDSFPTGDAVTPIACYAEAYVTVRVIEPQG